MTYKSEIQFTLDTICPWTHLARRRLAKALAQIPEASPVNFTIKYKPYQLYPEESQEGQNKFEWYKKSRYANSEDKMQMFQKLMGAYGYAEGINFNFHGTIANTIHAHRCIQHWQNKKGSQAVERFIDSLYQQYFEEAKHPSSPNTLLLAAKEAGIPEDEAKAFIEDEREELMVTKALINEQKGNGIDVVPHIVFEGKRRDITVEGCRETDDYLKVLNNVIRESS